ncbi:E3 ubiquitin protein ligase RIE1-like, partial [Trifolium medium]|nr:E3 ubiquitin protein ligase RIE1-like [Trifolium medium]
RRNGVGGGRDEEAFDEDVNDSEDDDGDVEFRNSSPSGFAKRRASLNTMLSLVWWMVGFYWVVYGGDVLMQDAPQLYW